MVFTSDNGARLLDHGRGQAGSNGALRCGKGTTWEGGLRVPGVISHPANIPPARSAALFSQLDLLPTVLGLAGLQSSALLDDVRLDGKDQTGSLVEAQPSAREEIVFIQSSASQEFGQIHALRRGDIKAHFYTEGNILAANEDLHCVGLRQEHEPPLLYNLAHDPAERWRLTPLNTDNYQDLLDLMVARREELQADLVWAPSRHSQSGEEAIPCCNKPCTPFPSCCSCGTV